MAKTIAQNSSANVVIGPLVDISGDFLAGLDIANTAIVLVKEASVSVARNATTSALSVGPGLYRIVLNTADSDTLGTLTIFVSGSAALSYAKDIDIWQSTTWALFFGSAEQILTSAAASAMVSVRVNAALVNYDVPTSADVSAITVGVLTNYDVPTSADISVMVSVGVHAALTNYDVPTSADVSAIVSAVVSGVLASYNVASAGEIPTSANVSAIVIQALADYDVPTSADVSVLVSVGVNAALTNFGVPTSAAMSAAMSAVGVLVLTNYDVPTSADVSAVAAGVLANYGVPTSAAMSAAISAVVGPAVWGVTAVEPGSAPEWTNASRGRMADWMAARAVNRHDQTATKLEIFTSAGAAIASASAGDDGTTARRDRFIG